MLAELSEWPYKGKPTWIFTSRELRKPEGEDVDVRMVKGEVAEQIDEIFAAAGERDLWVVGGGNVASQFADAGLLDDVLVTVVPVVLGEGKPLFDRRVSPGPFSSRAPVRSTMKWWSCATRCPRGRRPECDRLKEPSGSHIRSWNRQEGAALARRGRSLPAAFGSRPASRRLSRGACLSTTVGSPGSRHVEIHLREDS